MPRRNRIRELYRRRYRRTNIPAKTTAHLCPLCRSYGSCRNIFVAVSQNKRAVLSEYYNLIPLRVMHPELAMYSVETRKELQAAYDAFHQEDYEAAIRHFKTVLEESDRFGKALIGLALSYFFIGDYTNAARFVGYCIPGVPAEIADNLLELCTGYCYVAGNKANNHGKYNG